MKALEVMLKLRLSSGNFLIVLKDKACVWLLSKDKRESKNKDTQHFAPFIKKDVVVGFWLRRSIPIPRGILACIKLERLLFKFCITYLSSSLLVLHGEKSIKPFVCVYLNRN